MGMRVPKRIGDYPSFGLDFGVSCTACGRVAVYRPIDVEAFFDRRRISTALPVKTDVFTCKCGSREVAAIGVEIGQRPTPQEAFGALLHPIYVIKPKRPARG